MIGYQSWHNLHNLVLCNGPVGDMIPWLQKYVGNMVVGFVLNRIVGVLKPDFAKNVGNIKPECRRYECW